MAFSHGSKANFQITDAGSVNRDISAFLTSAGLDRMADLAEVTVFGNASKAFIPGLFDGTIPLAGEYDPTVDGYLAGILGLSRTWIYGPFGTTTGNVKYTGAAILVRYSVATEISAEAKITGELHISGDVTKTVF